MSDPDGILEYYGRWAPVYDRVARHTPGLAGLRTRAVDALELSAGATVVDMGCGTGANMPRLRERVGSEGTVVGIDVTPAQLRYARRLEPGVVLGDARRPPVSEVDGIIATFVIGLFDDPAKVIDRWLGRLGHGGVLVLLNARPSDRPGWRLANPAFRAFVRVSTPGPARWRGSPTDRLVDRLDRAERALQERTDLVIDEGRLGGFTRLLAGRKPHK